MASANLEPTKKMDMDMSDPPPPSPPASQPLSDADDIQQRKLDMYAAMRFHEPAVLMTTAAGYARHDGEITIDELLMPDKLKGAFLASKDWDVAWLKTKINEKSLGQYQLFIHAEDEDKKALYREQFGTGSQNHRGDRDKFCLHTPPLDRVGGAMNAKMMILGFGELAFLRLVITTANLVPADWGEEVSDHGQALKENMVFVADLPQLFEGDEDTNTDNDFFQGLFGFAVFNLLMGVTPPDSTNNEINHFPIHIFDFQKLAGFGLIYTASGRYKTRGRDGRDVPMGFYQLANFVAKNEDSDDVVDEDLADVSHEDAEEDSAALSLMEIDFVTQTLEDLDQKYLHTLYLAAQGDNSQELQRLVAEGVSPEVEKARHREVDMAIGDRWKEHIRIYYPSDMTVQSSNCGKDSAFDIRCPLTGPAVPKNLLRDCKSLRQGVLMGSNLWYVQFVRPRKLSTGSKVDGIFYVGSAGLSNSAWGRYTTHDEMSFDNYECGVVIPVTKNEEDPSPRVAKQTLKMFDHVVPVPMEAPGKKFLGGKQLWKVDPGPRIPRYLVNKVSDR